MSSSKGTKRGIMNSETTKRSKVDHAIKKQMSTNLQKNWNDVRLQEIGG